MRARLVFGIAAILIVAGCANTSLQESRRLIEAGRIEEGIAVLAKAAEQSPRDIAVKTALMRERDREAQKLVAQAEAAIARGDLVGAEAAFNRVLKIDPANPRATGGLREIEQSKVHTRQIIEAEDRLKRGDTVDAEARMRAVLAENPNHLGARALAKRLSEQAAKVAPPAAALRGIAGRTVTLEFRDAPLRAIFDVLARSTGLNFVFDREVRQDLKASIFVRNVNLEDVLGLLLTTNQLERRILNDNSILVYPATPAKQREYQELVLRSFYLANADAKQILAMIKTLVKTRDIYVDEKLNLITMRDTADAVRVAERLIAMHDLAEPEVMLEVEVLEMSSSRIQELGILYPQKLSYGFGLSSGAPPASVQLPVPAGTTPRFNVANPLATVNVRAQTGDANILANPRIRVKNRDKARVQIGERVPVVTTTVTANVGASTSVSYLDVGLRLDVEPTVFLEDEVGIKVGLEVSSILEQLQVGSAASPTIAYRLGTRNATTNLRLKDGETQVLAGLISDEERTSAAKIPGLGDFPVVGRLFGNNNDEKKKTEIVLLITPRVVRNIARPDTVPAEFGSGTEASTTLRPGTIGKVSGGGLSIQGVGGGSGAPSGGGGGPSIPPSSGGLPGLPPPQTTAPGSGPNALPGSGLPQGAMPPGIMPPGAPAQAAPGAQAPANAGGPSGGSSTPAAPAAPAPSSPPPMLTPGVQFLPRATPFGAQ